jgi:hypothetical protein
MHGKYPDEFGARYSCCSDQDLDKHLGDLYPSIIGEFRVRYSRAASPKNKEDRELEIIHGLAESVLPFAEAISEACDICAELDCLLCFADAANLYNYRRPRMSEENVIHIKQGRCVLVLNTRCGPYAHSFSVKAPIARANRRHIRAK